MKMYNTSLDTFKTQCDSRTYVFRPKEATEVRDDLALILEDRLKDYGVFVIRPEDSLETIKKKTRAALLAYRNGRLRERIGNFMARQDEERLRGATHVMNPAFDRALRWDKEITALLELEAPIEQELTFLNEEQRKKASLQEGTFTHLADKSTVVTHGLKATVFEVAEKDRLEKEEAKQKEDDQLAAAGEIMTAKPTDEIKPLAPRRGRPPKFSQVNKEI